MSQHQPAMTRQQWGSLFIISGIWAWSFVVYKVMGEVYQPLMIAFIRCAIGAAYLLCYLWYKKISLFTYKQYFPMLLLLSILGNIIPFTLSGLLIKDVGSAVSSIINSINPIFTAVLIRIFYDHHRLSLGRFSGILLSLLGITIMIGVDGLIHAQHNNWVYLVKEMSLMLVGFSFSVQATLTRRRDIQKLPAVVMVASQNIFSTIILLPIIFIFDKPLSYPFPPSLEMILMAVVYNVFSMGYAYIIYFNMIRKAGAVNASLTAMIMPPIGIFYAYLYFGEQLASHQLLGLEFITLGLVVIDGRLPKYIAKKLRLQVAKRALK
ncbi:MAG: DMT family transporter [Hydrotalea sp.]|nr:DMT family transporter [Hydrotalea sp.]